jgi:16S rRNA (adenine1518-N6/adenine1519-N6)-dimethyltransferase
MSLVAAARPSDRGSRPPRVATPGPSRPISECADPRAPTQPTLQRMRRFNVRPDRDLGQCFLVDSNILGVIDRAAGLGREDVVLEIGGGLGLLSEHLAVRVGHVHVLEVDERLRDALCDATDPHANAVVHWGDALKLDLRGLLPAPTKVVANLPYGIAAAALLRTIEELASVTLWVVMVQREVGQRLAAAPGSGAYGLPSVLAQLACEVEVVRAIPRTVFYPAPHVDSVLVALRRRLPTTGSAGAGAAPSSPSPALRALIGGAFAHRRKTLAGSLQLSAGAGDRSRGQVRAALRQLGHSPDVRAERLSPEDFRELGRLLGT